MTKDSNGEVLAQFQLALNLHDDFIEAIRGLSQKQIMIIWKTLAKAMNETGAGNDAANDALVKLFFERGFIVGFLNGLRTSHRAITGVMNQEVAEKVLRERRACCHDGCLNFRPGETDFCTEECRREAHDRSWRRRQQDALN